MADMNPEEIIRLTQLLVEFNKITENASKAVESLREAIERGNAGENARIELLTKESELQEARVKQAAAIVEFSKIEAEAKNKAIVTLDEQEQKTKKLIDAQEALKKKLEDTVQRIENNTKAGAKEKEQAAESIIKIAEITEKNKALNDELEKQRKQKELLLKAANDKEVSEAKEILRLNDLTQATKSLTAAMTTSLQSAAGINTQYSSLVATTLKAGNGTGLMNVALNASIGAFKDLVNPVNILSSAISFAIQNFQAWYKLLGDVNRTLGSTTKEAFASASGYGRSLGMSLQQQQSTVDSLSKAYVDLNNKTAYHSAEIMRASYLMQKYGVDSNSATTILSAFDNSLGMSAEQSAELSNQLVTTARSLGLATDAVNQLAKNMESLIVYGSRTNEVMTDVLSTSAKLGISTDSIVKMSDKLNTLSSVLEANAVMVRELGVSMDPLTFLRADPAQRMEMLAEKIKESGFQGEQAKYKIMALSQTFGLSNSEIQKLTKNVNGMNEGMGWLEEMVREADLAFQKAFGGRTLDGLEQLRVFIEKAARPLMFLLGALNLVLGAIFGFINFLTDLADKIPYVGTAIGGIVAALIAYALYAKGASFATKLFGGSIRTALTEAGAGVAGFMTQVSGAALALSESIPFVLMFAAAVLMTGVGIGIAAAGIALIVVGISMLVEQLGKLTIGKMAGVVVAIGILTFGLYQLAFALSALSLPQNAVGLTILLGVAIAFLAIGFAAKMAAEGFGVLYTGVGTMISAIAQLAKALKDISGLSFDASIGTVVTAMVAPFKGPDVPDDLEMKVRAVAQLPSALKEYGEAVAGFSAAGGAANAQVMIQSFKEAITTVNNNTTTTTTNAAEPINRFDLYLDGNYMGEAVRQEVFGTFSRIPNSGPSGR